MTVNLNIIPGHYRRYLATLAESLGGEKELQEILTPKRLRELLSFNGFTAVVRPWSGKIELRSHGFKGGSYRVYDEEWRFQHEVWPVDDCFGTNLADITLMWGVKNGSLVRITYEGIDDVHGGLLLCQNKMPDRVQRYWINVWKKANEVALWRPDDHEIILKQGTLPTLGYLRIHYLPGKFTEPKTPADFYHTEGEREYGVKDTVEFLDLPLAAIGHWYPKRSGWYLLRHQYALLNLYQYCAVDSSGQVNLQQCSPEEFPGSVPVVKESIRCRDLNCTNEIQHYRKGVRFYQNAPVFLQGLTGVGVRRVRYRGNGIFYLDLSGSNLAPALPASNVYGVGSPQHAFDPSSWTRLEATLSYDVRGSSLDQDVSALTPNLNWLANLDEDDNIISVPIISGITDEETLQTYGLVRGTSIDSEELKVDYGVLNVDDKEELEALMPITGGAVDDEELEALIPITSMIEDEDESQSEGG